MQQAIRVAISRDDGSVAIMSFLIRGRGSALPKTASWTDTPGEWIRGPTHENIFGEISRTYWEGPQPTGYRIIDEAEIPADRTFRNALVDRDGSLTHDMPKARDIHLARLRRHRANVLPQLDADWMRAADKATKASVEAKRQAWRAMPDTVIPLMAAASTPEELKRVTFSAPD